MSFYQFVFKKGESTLDQLAEMTIEHAKKDIRYFTVVTLNDEECTHVALNHLVVPGSCVSF